MQELILVISRCISRKKGLEKGLAYYKFHFKGYYAGEKIKEIHLYKSKRELEMEHLSKGDDYLLWVKSKRVYQEILEVELIKYKKII
ncbi:MAG: hypothetical protein Q7U04_13925 [Bacteriovorax sp.]|nr:hypothetical protein [Bacteriovorax sp.]